MSRKRKFAAIADGEESVEGESGDADPIQSSSNFRASSAVQNTRPKEQDTIKFTSGAWTGLAIRFGRDYDLMDGLTMRAGGSRLRLMEHAVPNPLDLEYSVTFLFNSEKGNLEATETLTRPETSSKVAKIIISRSACVSSNNMIVLKSDNHYGDYVSAAFFIRIALKSNIEFDMVTLGDDWAAGEQSNAMFLKTYASKMRNMRFVEVRIPNYQQKRGVTGGSLFNDMEVQNRLQVNELELETFKYNNPYYDASRLRRPTLSDDQIQISTLVDGVSQPIHSCDAMTLASEAREQRPIAATSYPPFARRLSLISD